MDYYPFQILNFYAFTVEENDKNVYKKTIIR